MTTQTATTSVKSSIVVEAPIERAFSVFTEGIGSWWPPEHHILQAELAKAERAYVDPRACADHLPD